ncbi:phospholipid/cholesterol/gamma-HCH transport system substrate-binding protein [Nocardioides sp. J9]|uniref:MlaD family protein n=1 Tax=Nocardioides sp. J9 TaxID=935844 RepID=UPI0011A58B5A|nr:MlaD family protein [Nocardioides sp. J9]TWG91555.1 phospholipid/cholesterol/gamma-HCH transport system substrate-binding protein [Nocardioides sp. J9]
MNHQLRRLAVPGLLAAALVATGCEIQPNDNTLPGQAGVGDDGYSVTVHFDQIENLVPNSTVQKDNVVIGTVAKIDVEDWEAVVELRLLDDVALPKDSVFSIGQKTLLGAQYVEVTTTDDTVEGDGSTGEGAVLPASATAGTDGLLADGDVVGVEQTGTYPATEQVLGAVALLLNNGGLSQISTITGELSTALRDRVPDTRSLVRRTNRLLAVLDANRGEIVAALESLNDLAAGLRKDEKGIAKAIDQITPGLEALEEERAALVRAVTETGRTGNRAVKVVRASQSALLANLDSLGPILTNLGKASNKLPEALKIGATIPFPAMTTTEAVRGDFANLFATIDLRTDGLVDAWLGGLTPSMQAGDPVQGPLTTPGTAPKGKEGTKPEGKPADETADEGDARAPSLLEDLLSPKSGKSGKSGQSGKNDEQEQARGCLLRILGLC